VSTVLEAREKRRALKEITARGVRRLAGLSVLHHLPLGAFSARTSFCNNQQTESDGGKPVMKLTPGQFLGVPVKTRFVGGFVFTEYVYPERTVLRRHCHELAYFSLVLGGSYQEQCSHRQVRLCDSKNVLYHPAGETHSDAFGDCGGAIFSIELDPKWTSTLREYELQADESLALPSRDVSSLAWRAYKAFSDAEQRSGLLLEAMALELVYQLPWRHSAKAESGTPRWLKDVVEILHAEFCRPFSLTVIASRVGAHPVHLARAFRHRYRMTVGQYVRRLRVDYAMNALTAGHSLSDIAADAGFSDQSHLGRVFRAATGMTPRQFRLANRRPGEFRSKM
jgi:AraC family transcriptional regulator